MSINELLKSYAQPPEKQDPRLIEAWGLTQAALLLRSAKESGDANEMRAALRLNWRLWTIFQAELLAPECTIAADLRSNVLSLAAFIDKRTMALLADTDPAAIDVLVNINRELAMGLYESVDARSAPETEAPAQPTSGLTISI